MTVRRPRIADRRGNRSSGVQDKKPAVRLSGLNRPVVSLVGATVLLLAVVGSSAIASSTKSSTSGDNLSGKLTMNVFTFTTPVMKPVIAAFQKLHPHVKISAANVVNTPSTYVPMLQTEKLAGNEPMINETYDVLTPTLEVDHLVGDLTPNLKLGKPYPQSYWLPTFEASYIPPPGAPSRRGARVRARERG